MKNKTDIRLKGTTLVETLAAMTLIAIVFGIAMMVYSNVTSNSGLYETSRAYPILQSMMEKTIMEEDFSNNNISVEGLLIRKEIEEYGSFGQVFHIRLSAELGKEEILSMDRLVHIDNERK